MLLTETQAKAVCKTLLQATSADDARVSVASSDYLHLRFAANDFTTNGRRETVSARVTVWIDRKRASASASSLDEETLRATVQQAEELARVSPVDQEYMPTLGPQVYRRETRYEEATAHLSLSKRAAEIEAVIRSCEEKELIGAGFHQSEVRAGGMATRHGLFHYSRSTSAALSVTARTPDGGSSGRFCRDHFNIRKLDTARIGREAVRKALDSRGPRVLEPGVYPVILEAQAVGDLVQLGFDARSADEGRSPFSAPGGKTKVGEQIFDPRLNIYSDPWHPELPGPADARDGVPAEKVYSVRNGVLVGLVYSRYWAAQKHQQPTHGPVNFILESASKPVRLEEMIRATSRGLLVSRFWYVIQVDPRTALFTGLTRDGVWWIENGKIQYPVANFRFNQSVLDLLAPGNVEMIGTPERILGQEADLGAASLVPPIKVKAFHFTSKSEAV